ncbi:hypothetical protein [Streptosporangium sp. NPDC006930]|uniref:hypothetical protein n=1 Tax=Streptosporangium sp. NPDC006930 TaxID=3154783 RepID=UPI003446FA33
MAADQRTVSAQRRMAANRSWAMTPNRSERTAAARAASPTSLEYWEARIRAEGVVRSQDIKKAAVNARRAHMQAIRAKGVARRAAEKQAREAERQARFQRSA